MSADATQNGADRKRRGKRGEAATETPPPFEAQLEELGSIVTAMEDGRLPLEETLALYERGMRLAKACHERLDNAELQVRMLRATVFDSDADTGMEDDDSASEVGYTLEPFDLDD